MVKTDPDQLERWYIKNSEKRISGRRITREDIDPLLDELSEEFIFLDYGTSYQNRKINSLKIGKGKTKILLWSQMHGNESTGTKALFDLFNFFKSPGELKNFKEMILQYCTLCFIPLLNPDGAEVYTRVNARETDLNRDAVTIKEPESKFLQKVLKEFNPKYCFNLHDQRTIFSTGENKQPATLSFLAPSEDEERTLTSGRKDTMQVIIAMKQLLDQLIPGQTGRYTDEFYPTATGDNFQKAGYNTILIESGHYINDYQREFTRKFTFFSILEGLLYLSGRKKIDTVEEYFKIPENEKFFLDVILRNVTYQDKYTDIGILFKEKFRNGKLYFFPEVEKTGDLSDYKANTSIEASTLDFQDKNELIEYIKKYTLIY